MDSVMEIAVYVLLIVFGVSWISVMGMRSVIAAKFLTDTQFETFQENGLASFFGKPSFAALSWESKYLIEVLSQSSHPSAPLFANLWRLSVRLFCVSGIVFMILLIAVNVR